MFTYIGCGESEKKKKASTSNKWKQLHGVHVVFKYIPSHFAHFRGLDVKLLQTQIYHCKVYPTTGTSPHSQKLLLLVILLNVQHTHKNI
jgi:hypothetical protein